jgi:iron-sulfur cluster assembly protein
MEAEKQYSISVSPKAAEQVQRKLIERGTPDGMLRLGVKGGGCSGLTYVLLFEDNSPKAKDLVFEVEGIRVVVDPKSIVYLNGTVLDWEKTLLKTGFKFLNPQEKSTCGCGVSFSVVK